MGLIENHNTNPNHTVGMLKNEVLVACRQMIVSAGFDWDEVRNTQMRPANELKEAICAFAYEALIQWMDETEIAELVGIKRPCFRDCRYRYKRKCNEQLSTPEG